jgi:hypothetical protein
MKKLLAIVVLGLLWSNISFAKEKDIGNGLVIKIPNNYKYFELTFKQLISRFPDVTGSDEQLLDDLGIGMNSKLIVITNNKKSIKFFKDVTSITGLEKLMKKYIEPYINIMADPKVLKMMFKDIKKINPNITATKLEDLMDELSENEFMELWFEVFQNPKTHKKYEKMLAPITRKFNKAYNLDKYTILLTGDKKVNFLDEIKNKNNDELVQITKDLLNEIYESSNDPTLKNLKDLQFEIAKNSQGNLYFYTDDKLDSPFMKTNHNNKIFLTSHKDKIIMIGSFCVNCNEVTDFTEIIGPANLYK